MPLFITYASYSNTGIKGIMRVVRESHEASFQGRRAAATSPSSSTHECEDRANVELIFLDTESSLSLCELDVGLPELLIAPIGDVRAQQIGALRERGPIVEGGVMIGPETQACRAAVRLQRDGEAGGGTLVLLQDAADLPVHRRRIEPFH